MKKILFVDDETYILRAIKIKLQGTEFEVFLASSIEVALGIVKKEDIDVLVTDIIMPNGNGLNLIEEISKIDSHVLIMVLSGNTHVAVIIELFKYKNIFRYIPKPWTIDEEAIALIEEAVTTSKRIRRLKHDIKKHKLEGFEDQDRYMA